MKSVSQIYGNKLRVRVSGIMIEKEAVLLLKHEGLGPAGFIWAPPGGGVEFNSNLESNLKREFYEETGLSIDIVRFMFVNEVMMAPLHAIELFFLVKKIDGSLTLGQDPEMEENNQILKSIEFLPFTALNKIEENNLHNLFKHCSSISELLNMKGYFNY